MKKSVFLLAATIIAAIVSAAMASKARLSKVVYIPNTNPNVCDFPLHGNEILTVASNGVLATTVANAPCSGPYHLTIVQD
ncbi:hypothetical protein HHL17_25775 [Chitinophaga sp. G-6-1-13]|uniref:Uncharacterized protein n=1 Tax=Chitinophaga fulva TaxID=2728842 RepID=A0A848GU10_9BACT|nr:hypothetical protein [Chitinophaga fulva]NML40632.1 hypothetical protein [Chitinophaga fulva]